MGSDEILGMNVSELLISQSEKWAERRTEKTSDRYAILFLASILDCRKTNGEEIKRKDPW